MKAIGRALASLSAAGAVVVLAITPGWSRGTERSADAVGRTAAHPAVGATLPMGWHRAQRRLVPLLSPREILSAGTAPMPVGGGGNCGRYPVAALARMGARDGLVSIQEYRVGPGARWVSNIDRRPRQFSVDQLYRVSFRTRGGHTIRYRESTISFRVGRRVFDALVLLGPAAGTRRKTQATRILDSLRLGDANAAASHPPAQKGS